MAQTFLGHIDHNDPTVTTTNTGHQRRTPSALSARRVATLARVIRLLVAVAMFFVIMKLGLFILRALARPIPEPPPSGEMRRVNLRFRCSNCGVELKMTAAPDEDPPPPRHCLEDMQLVAPPIE